LKGKEKRRMKTLKKKTKTMDELTRRALHGLDSEGNSQRNRNVIHNYPH
jgi:hypothetical protein